MIHPSVLFDYIYRMIEKIQERIYDMSEYVAKVKDLLCFSWLKIFIKNTLLLFVAGSFVISFFF